MSRSFETEKLLKESTLKILLAYHHSRIRQILQYQEENTKKDEKDIEVPELKKNLKWWSTEETIKLNREIMSQNLKNCIGHIYAVNPK